MSRQLDWTGIPGVTLSCRGAGSPLALTAYVAYLPRLPRGCTWVEWRNDSTTDTAWLRTPGDEQGDGAAETPGPPLGDPYWLPVGPGESVRVDLAPRAQVGPDHEFGADLASRWNLTHAHYALGAFAFMLSTDAQPWSALLGRGPA